MNKFALILVFLLSLVKLEYVVLDKIEYRFGTKTPYRLLANDDLNLGSYPGCELKKIWMMIRHGTRYPSAKTMRDMKQKLPNIKDEIMEIYKKGQGNLTAKEISAFEFWSPLHVDESEAKKLVSEGRDEMFLLAKRMQERFSGVIPYKFDNNTMQGYREENVQFKNRYLNSVCVQTWHTPTQRANESAQYFAEGLFGKGVKDFVTIPSAHKNDPVLRFYKNCENWRTNVKKNNKTFEELYLYLKSKEMKDALHQVSKKFGFSKIITQDIGRLIFQTCAFESAWSKESLSPWCSAFTENTIQPFEYAEDLKYYWMDGYGHPITQKLPCMVLEDIISLFSKSGGHVSAFHFTHSGTLLKTLAFFGLYKSNAPLRHNIRDPNRPWRSSRIDAFGSNIAFLLYRCGTSDKFLTLHQERPVHLPGCGQDSHLCPLEVLHNARNTEDCDIDEICKLPTIKDEL